MRPLLLTTLLAALPIGCAGAPSKSTEPKAPGPQIANAQAAHQPPPTTDKLEPYQCGAITRMHTLGGLFLASQPAATDFEQAKKGGIQTVVNLRHDDEQPGFDERAIVESLGLAYVQVPWNSPDELTDAVFDRSREVLNSVKRPALVHCGSANRVGAIWLAWRALDGGLSIEAAEAEAKTVGVKTQAYADKAKDYVARHKKGSD